MGEKHKMNNIEPKTIINSLITEIPSQNSTQNEQELRSSHFFHALSCILPHFSEPDTLKTLATTASLPKESKTPQKKYTFSWIKKPLEEFNYSRNIIAYKNEPFGGIVSSPEVA